MAVYNYTGFKDGTNDIVKGKIEADNMRDARAAIRTLGLIPTSLIEKSYSYTIKKR